MLEREHLPSCSFDASSVPVSRYVLPISGWWWGCSTKPAPGPGFAYVYDLGDASDVSHTAAHRRLILAMLSPTRYAWHAGSRARCRMAARDNPRDVMAAHSSELRFWGHPHAGGVHPARNAGRPADMRIAPLSALGAHTK